MTIHPAVDYYLFIKALKKTSNLHENSGTVLQASKFFLLTGPQGKWLKRLSLSPDEGWVGGVSSIQIFFGIFLTLQSPLPSSQLFLATNVVTTFNEQVSDTDSVSVSLTVTLSLHL